MATEAQVDHRVVGVAVDTNNVNAVGSIGQHILLDLYGCNPVDLMNPNFIQLILTQAAYSANAHILNAYVN